MCFILLQNVGQLTKMQIIATSVIDAVAGTLSQKETSSIALSEPSFATPTASALRGIASADQLLIFSAISMAAWLSVDVSESIPLSKSSAIERRRKGVAGYQSRGGAAECLW